MCSIFFSFSFFPPSKGSLTSKPRLTGSFFEFSSGCIELHLRRRYWRLSGINNKEKQSSKQIFTSKPSLPYFKPSPTSRAIGNNRSALSRPQESPRDVSFPHYTFDCISHRILPQSELPGVANAQSLWRSLKISNPFTTINKWRGVRFISTTLNRVIQSVICSSIIVSFGLTNKQDKYRLKTSVQVWPSCTSSD